MYCPAQPQDGRLRSLPVQVSPWEHHPQVHDVLPGQSSDMIHVRQSVFVRLSLVTKFPQHAIAVRDRNVLGSIGEMSST